MKHKETKSSKWLKWLFRLIRGVAVLYGLWLMWPILFYLAFSVRAIIFSESQVQFNQMMSVIAPILPWFLYALLLLLPYSRIKKTTNIVLIFYLHLILGGLLIFAGHERYFWGFWIVYILNAGYLGIYIKRRWYREFGAQIANRKSKQLALGLLFYVAFYLIIVSLL